MKTYQQVPGGVTAPADFLAAGVAAGIKQSGNKDLALVYSRRPCSAAGVFTRNVVKAAPVLLNMEHLAAVRGQAQAIVVNSGNANACTGEQGMADAARMAALTGESLGVAAEQVLVASTGVIGELLPMAKVIAGIEQGVAALTADGGAAAAQAIMTTDLAAKEIAIKLTLQGKEITLGAMAKGSGMIHPNMATMLAFVTTDAAVEATALQAALHAAVADSFNMLTVDGDTSTNDLLLVLANGAAGNSLLTVDDAAYGQFVAALTHVCTHLAKAIARDGEGATKFLEVRVKNAGSQKDARLAAKAVAASNLVKTALFGGDANWGRILCAVGYSGAQFEPGLVDIHLASANGRLQTAARGAGIPFDEARAAAILAAKDIVFEIDLRQGPGEAAAYTCDFSYDYVKINADYRT